MELLGVPVFGIDIEEITSPFIKAMTVMGDRLERVIELLEEVSKKLDK